ncbi:MAG: 30S ribosomal protein S8 [Planctomycetota bacterium]|nr:MAG: 30S ribosomal protein S8 [Planctomycetota bacterium]
MMTDPLADMLTRIRNALAVQRETVSMPASRTKRDVADVLKREGFITDFEVTPDGVQGLLTVTLKYGKRGEAVLNVLRRESKPGRRFYRGVKEIHRVLNGTGISIYSTPDGVLSDRECRERNVGGEMIATVW